MSRVFSGSRKRVFVLGIDGVPCSLMERFLGEGRMPQLAALLGGARLTTMTSCYPTVSNVAWTCFQTGKSAGGFGVFGFAELTAALRLRIPNSGDVGARTVWEILSDAGRRVIALGFPLSYPPRPVNGILVGGFLAPKLDGAVYPGEMLPQVRSWGYELDIDPIKARQSIDSLKEGLVRCLAGRERTIMELLDSQEWDLFGAHVMETDRINHFMWRFLEEPETENGAFFLDFYRRLDDLIGVIAGRLGSTAELIILSDHGFCATRREVQVNRWLEEKGYLSYDGAPEGFTSLATESRAFSLVPGRIHILREGAWDKGTVSEGAYEAVREGIIADLKGWRDPETGEQIPQHVFRREEIFHGPFVERAPDILVHPRNGYDLKAALGSGALFTSSPLQGMHTRDDALLVVRGRALPSSARPNILDVMPTVLGLLGVESPGDLDGKMLLA